MRLNKKLAEWQRAGLIDSQTADNIMAHEKSESKPIALWAAGGVGAFAIVVGIVSIVAANWLHTPDEIKLGAALLISALLGFSIYKNHQSSYKDRHSSATSQNFSGTETSAEKQWLKEVLVVIYYGFTLAAMALIGQIYQLDGSIGMLLLVWTLGTLPLVLLASGKFIATLWVAASAATYFLNIAALYDFATQTLNFSRDTAEAIAISLVLIGPLFFIYLSRLPWLLQHRATYANEISRYSWLAIVVGGFFAQFLWYEGKIFNDNLMTVLVVTGIATAITLAMIPKLYSAHENNIHLAMRVVLLIVFALIFTACWHDASLPIVGALTNLTYLGILAWAALKIGSPMLFNGITAIISIRVLFVYFEVFGNMMQTGIGLVIGGLLTLLLAWLWFKKSNRLADLLQNKNEKDEGTTHG